ncbi:MAG: DUF2695 domain-containing protein [Planctomycetia bacterium]|nr:DUF2695 domain-containing protein [Planctomycetia bacterium]
MPQPPPDLLVPAPALRDLFAHLNQVSGTGYECDHRFTLTTAFLRDRTLQLGDTLAWLGANGAGCDCEVIFNVAQRWGESVGYEPLDDDELDDDDMEPIDRADSPSPPRSKPWWRFW